MRKIYFTILLLLAAGCGKGKAPVYRIGIDPSWYPIELMGKEASVSAFTSDLLAEISEREHVSFEKMTVSWDNLLWGLREERYDAMLSSLYPYVFNQDTYDFSEMYLNIGPVLITKLDSDVDSIEDITDREIGVAAGQEEALLLAHDPEVIVRRYDSIPDAFQKVAGGELDGALVGALTAASYVRDLYSDKVRIVTSSLTREGLRLVTLSGHDKELVKKFNRAINDLKDDGTYLRLARKWKIIEPE